MTAITPPSGETYYCPPDQIGYGNLSPEEIASLKNRNGGYLLLGGHSFNIIQLIRGNYFLSRPIKGLGFFFGQISESQMIEIARIPHLSRIVFTRCQLSLKGVKATMAAMNLVTLEMMEMRVGKKLKALVASTINSLVLSHCHLKDKHLKILAKGKFQKLDLSGDQRDHITLQGALALSSSATIIDLSLSGLVRSWKMDDKVELGKALAQNPKLIRLDIFGNKMGYGIGKLLAGSPSLEYLDFSDNAGGGESEQTEAFRAFADNRVLKTLKLNNGEVRDEDLIALGRNPFMTSLSLAQNNFTDQGLNIFANHPSITDLDVSCNPISGRVRFNQFVHLQALNVSNIDNAIDCIEKELATLPNLTELRIGGNQLGSGIEVFKTTTTLVYFSFSPVVSDNYDYNNAMKVINARTAVNRRVVHNWQRICFLLASSRANRESFIRDSALTLCNEVMNFLSFPHEEEVEESDLSL